VSVKNKQGGKIAKIKATAGIRILFILNNNAKKPLPLRLRSQGFLKYANKTD